MKKLILLAFLWPVLLCAEITGPTTSTGSFTLSWDQSAAILYEIDSSGTAVDYWLNSPASISKPDGTYTYWEYMCIYMPFYQDWCFTVDTHQIAVNTGVGTPGSNYPETPKAQAAYEYEFRSGDFNGDGKIDVLVDRITGGPIDGSMQPYIIYQKANGVLEAKKPLSSQLAYARTFPINNTLNLMPGDINADGYADHMVENLRDVMGPSVVDGYVVFAAGSAADKTKPLGATEMNDQYMSFTGELSQWLNDDTYFADNIVNTIVPIYSFGFSCSYGFDWFSGITGFFSQSFCFPTFNIVSYVPAQYGVNFSALAASGHLDNIFSDIDNISDDDLWQLSQVAKAVFNVHLFGFDDSGVRQPTNHGEDNDADEKAAALIQFSYMLMAAGEDIVVQQPNVTHDYQVETEICSTSEAFCTLANIACWGRHYHAPLEDKSGHNTPVQNGEISDLEDAFWHENEIRTGVGEAAGLPPNAIANVTEPSHILHDTDGPGFGICPKPVANQGAGSVNECSQVYREPFVEGGKIKMRTRGFGDNRFAVPNQIAGPWIFRKLDEDMIEAIGSTVGGLCPSL